MTKNSEFDAGQIVSRHRAPEPFKAASPSHDGGFFEEIEAHLDRAIGPFGMVMHELVSDQVHVDVFEFEPTANRPFYTYVTCGMSDKPMTVPKDLPDRRLYERAELVMSFPNRMSSGDWPVAWLKRLARFPHVYRTGLWIGHSVPNGNPAKPLGPDTVMTGAVLGALITWPPEALVLLTTSGTPIFFFGVYPVHFDEMALTVAKGSKVLLDRFKQVGITEVFNPRRASVARGWSS